MQLRLLADHDIPPKSASPRIILLWVIRQKRCCVGSVFGMCLLPWIASCQESPTVPVNNSGPLFSCVSICQHESIQIVQAFGDLTCPGTISMGNHLISPLTTAGPNPIWRHLQPRYTTCICPEVEPGICVFCGKQPEELETRRLGGIFFQNQSG